MKLFRWFKKPRAEVQVFRPDEFGDIDDLLKDLDSAPPIEPIGNSLTTSVVRVPAVYEEPKTVDTANASDNSYATIAAENKRVYRAAVKEVLINKLRSY